jgi:hypothetical protein
MEPWGVAPAGRSGRLGRRGLRATTDTFSAHGRDVIEIAIYREVVSGPRQPHIQVLAATGVADPVDGKNDSRPFESLEAEDVPIEHVVVGKERIPVTARAVKT